MIAASFGACCVVMGILIIAPRGLTGPLAHDANVLADRYAGVLALLALTGAVVAGLVAALRGPLTPVQRLRMQAVHRAASTAAVGALALHIIIKVTSDEVAVGQVVAPTHALTWQSGHVVAVALGSVAAYLLLFVVVTGVARGWFAGTGRPVRWRILHSMAYACWFVSAWHGLTAGRHPATWVTVSYIVCGAACAAVVVVRLVERHRRRGRSLTSTGGVRMVGVPTTPARSGGAHAASGSFPTVRAGAGPAQAAPRSGAGFAAQAAPRSGAGFAPQAAPRSGAGFAAQAAPRSGAGFVVPAAPVSGPAFAGGPTSGTGLRSVSRIAPISAAAPRSGAGLMSGAQAARADLARAARTGEWSQVPPANRPVSAPASRSVPEPPPAAPVVPRQAPRAPQAATNIPAGAGRVSRRRRGRGHESGISDEAFWAYMKGKD
ncbi:hypothetical protein GCM10009681_32370 [Luedemannella helvata]|uniref:Ferric oxidoreductase domain-containing protein n=1 Tax=Luedemannella helvata TaxID=349315 RepID=A0ABN2KKC5_9ACTN